MEKPTQEKKEQQVVESCATCNFLIRVAIFFMAMFIAYYLMTIFFDEDKK